MRQFLVVICVFFSFCSLSQSRYVRAENLYEEALESYRQRSLSQAEQLIEESIQLNATAESYYLSGLINEALGEEMKALAFYEATLKYNPDHKEAIFQKALIYLNSGEAEKALSDFNTLLENSNDIETHGVYFQIDPIGATQNKILTLANLTGQLYHYRGQAYQRLGKYDEALRDYTRAVEVDTAADHYIARALLQSKLGNDSLAVLDLKKALEVEPGNQFGWYNLALIKPDMDIPDSLLTKTTFSPIINLMGARALESGDYQEANRYFNLYLENNEFDALGYINRGRVLLKRKQFRKAREDFEKARKIDPARAEVLYLTGNSYFFQKEYRSALAYYNQYLAIDPTNAIVWYNGAMSYLELGDYNEACHFLENADKYGMEEAKKIIGRHCQ